ncbi:MAG: DUF3291 domain-containing protein [Pseudomonadota bacterium]
MTENTHIAELNVAYPKYDVNDRRFAGFINNLDRINVLAERSPGFVWRLKDDVAGNAMDLQVDDNPALIPNLSVWETVEDLERFTFGTVHAQIYKLRKNWFTPMQERHFVMWRVPVGYRPTLEEAMAKLAQINTDGPSDDVFGWEAMTNLKLWMEKRCA